jgi:uncharacterized BrkB/YihY/UPF0761 family membrane protein
MRRFLSAVSVFLMSCWAFAATKEIESGANAPVDTVDVVWVVVFVVGFFAMIVGFFVYFWWLEKKKKKTE